MTWGGRPWISRPSKRTRPLVGWRKPEMMLASVVLPDPFGPIRPNICPLFMPKETRSSARRPPKCMLMSSTASSITHSIATAALREDAAGQIEDHQDDQYSDEHHAQRGAETGVFLPETDEPRAVVEELDDEGSGERSQMISGASQNDHRPDQKGLQRHEVGGIDEAEKVREERAAEAGDGTADGHGPDTRGAH